VSAAGKDLISPCFTTLFQPKNISGFFVFSTYTSSYTSRLEYAHSLEIIPQNKKEANQSSQSINQSMLSGNESVGMIMYAV
jgi:hypothetical protein